MIANNQKSIPLVDLQAQYLCIKPAIDAAIQRVLNHTGFILGKEVSDFEQSFAEFVHTKSSVGVASGTAALRLALQACGVGPGDEVITTSHTFIATAEAISQAGARPIFVDIDVNTYNIDPNCIENVLAKQKKSRNKNRIRALMPVHLYGRPANMQAITDIAKKYDLWIIEDAAQAHAAEINGHRCGSIGHVGCFSFYPGKNLGAYGDAGIVTSNQGEIITRIRRLRDHGRSTKYTHQEIGWGERMDALQASILGAKLPYLENWTELRRKHARTYSSLLNGTVITPSEDEDLRHVYHLYVIRTPDREGLLAYLNSKNIGASIHYPVPLHRQPAYNFTEVKLPITEQAANEVISLPMYPEMTEEQITFVADAVKEYVRR